MNLIILGTDHRLQLSDANLKECIAALVESAQVTLIGEEYTPNGVAHQVAASKGIKWIPMDMNEQQRNDAGVGDLSSRRLQCRADRCLPDDIPIYAPQEDGLREDFWLTQIEKEQTHGTVLAICGAVHAKSLSEKAKAERLQYQSAFPPRSSGVTVLEVEKGGGFMTFDSAETDRSRAPMRRTSEVPQRIMGS